MEFGSTILHNVESLIRDEEAGDYLLCRVPEPVPSWDSGVCRLKATSVPRGFWRCFRGITREATK